MRLRLFPTRDVWRHGEPDAVSVLSLVLRFARSVKTDGCTFQSS